jgi:hypothetical protein
VVRGLDLTLFQHLRVAAGGNTLVPTENVASALQALGYDEGADAYETLARAESLACTWSFLRPSSESCSKTSAARALRTFPNRRARRSPRSQPKGPLRGRGVRRGTVKGGAAGRSGSRSRAPRIGKPAGRPARTPPGRGAFEGAEPAGQGRPRRPRGERGEKGGGPPGGAAGDAPGTTEWEGEAEFARKAGKGGGKW